MLRRVLTMVAVAALSLAAGCDDGGSPQSEPSATVSTPTGSPFSAKIEGPDFATSGDVVTITVTNSGRLPDKFALRYDPAGSAVSDPLEVTLGPGESADLKVTLRTLPLVLRVESIGGGADNALDRLSIGEKT